MNIFQVDLEHFYCDYHINVKEWDNIDTAQKYRERTIYSTEKLLDVLKKHNINCTFFILGCVAKRYPELIERIEQEGHEIASHGYWHVLVTQQSTREFEDDLKQSIKILRKISQNKIIGYRASNYTLTENTSWIIKLLKMYRLKYDSSILPFKTKIYGVPDAPIFPYRISSRNIKIDSPEEDFLEIPLSVYKISPLKMNIPFTGGFYFRLFPYWFIKHGIKKINRIGKPAVCSIHNWELDPGQTRIKPLQGQLYHYWRLSSTEKKLNKLFKDFDFISTREWIEKEGYL